MSSTIRCGAVPAKAADGGSKADSVTNIMVTGQLAGASNQPVEAGEPTGRGEDRALPPKANTHREPSPSRDGRANVAQMASITPANLDSRIGVELPGERPVSPGEERVLAAVQQRR